MKTASWASRPIPGTAVRPALTISAVSLWRALLGVNAALNLGFWSLCALASGPGHLAAGGFTLQLFLSAMYVLGCAFRSILPAYDIPRLVLLDSRLSSVMVGRTVATIAELCFAAQWALLLEYVARLTHCEPAHILALTIVPLILVAEVCSWHAVLTTCQRGHIAENSLWGVSAAIMVAGLLLAGPSQLRAIHPLVLIWAAGGIAYAAFIFCFDVPTYWSRWRNDQARGHRSLSLRQGVSDTWQRRVVSYRWEDWKGEILWMSLYFTFGVWSSISLAYAAGVLDGRFF